jgi:hypothetical protein
VTEPSTNDPVPQKTTSANATLDFALHLPLAAHQQPIPQTTAAEKTPATATTTAKPPAATETATAIVNAIPTTAAAIASKPSPAPSNPNPPRHESKKKKAKSSSVKSALRHHRQHALAAAAESRIAGANRRRRLAEAIASAHGRLEGRRIAMGPRDEIAVVVRRVLIGMCLAEGVLLLVRGGSVGVGVVSGRGTVRSGGSRIGMCLESAVVGRGTEVVTI